MEAGKEIKRPVIMASLQRWSEFLAMDIVRAVEDESRSNKYSNAKISRMLNHAIVVLKRSRGNVYSSSRFKHMFWGRIMVWSLPTYC